MVMESALNVTFKKMSKKERNLSAVIAMIKSIYDLKAQTFLCHA
jgi:hypothetical protein